MGLDRRLRRLERSVPSPRKRFEELDGKEPGDMTNEELVAAMLGHWPSRDELEEALGKYRAMSVEELFDLVRDSERESSDASTDSTSDVQLDKI